MTYPIDFDLPHAGLKYLEWYDKHKVWHPGQDLNKGTGNADLGLPIKCPVSGEVEYVSPEPTALNGQNGGFGNFIVIYHPAYGVWTRYAHMNKVSVKQNDKVKEGDLLGEVGKTGTKSAHLHWEGWNSSMYEIQKNHWRRFCYYPSGQSKQYVTTHYFDPLAWVESLKPETALNWCKTHLPDADWSNATEGEAERFRSLAKQIMLWSK